MTTNTHRLTGLATGLAVTGILLNIVGDLQGALIFPKPPDGAQALAATNLSYRAQQNAQIAERDRTSKRGRTRVPGAQYPGDTQLTNAAQVTFAFPHREYVNVWSWLDGVPLSIAVSSNAWKWQFLLLKGTNVVGAARVAPAGQTESALEATSIREGPLLPRILRAIRVAEALPQVKQRDYEVRHLDIFPPVAFDALWLHAESDDIFLPIPPPPVSDKVGEDLGGLKAYQPCSEAQLLEVLKPRARNIDRSPGSGY
jgi:hypothetical protein